ncbi:MAG: amidohydrolase family protein [Actinomycetota bacterium]
MNHTPRNIFLWAATFAFLEPLLRERVTRSSPRDPVAWAPNKGESVLLRGLEIVDVDKGQVLHRRGLLIRDGRIKDVIPERVAATYPADRIIDAPGFYALPGLINAHCHILLPMVLDLHPDVMAALKRQAERNLEECIVHGVTTVRDAGSFPLLLLRFKERIERGELLGPRILMAGSFITAPGGYPSDYLKPLLPSLARRWGDHVLVVKTPASAKEAVKRNHELGCCFIKTALDDRALFVGQKSLPTLEDHSIAAVVEQAHDLDLKVSAHHRFRRGFKRALKLGLDGLEHLPSDDHLSDEEVEVFVSRGMYVVPTATVGWALSGLSHGDPFLDHPQVRRFLAHRSEFVRSFYPNIAETSVYRAMLRFEKHYRDPSFVERRHFMYTLDPSIFTEALVKGNENLMSLYHAKALIGCGNDGGIPKTSAALVGLELYLLREAGMEPADVLRAATVNNARIQGLEDELGILRPGKLADVVLVAGNPLQAHFISWRRTPCSGRGDCSTARAAS